MKLTIEIIKERIEEKKLFKRNKKSIETKNFDWAFILSQVIVENIITRSKRF
jgi:hypothetical protein